MGTQPDDELQTAKDLLDLYKFYARGGVISVSSPDGEAALDWGIVAGFSREN